MFSCNIGEIFKNTYSEEHLSTDASINERQQETHALSGKKRIPFSKPMARATSASRKLQLLEFDSITELVLLCFSILPLWIMNLCMKL